MYALARKLGHFSKYELLLPRELPNDSFYENLFLKKTFDEKKGNYEEIMINGYKKNVLKGNAKIKYYSIETVKDFIPLSLIYNRYFIMIDADDLLFNQRNLIIKIKDENLELKGEMFQCETSDYYKINYDASVFIYKRLANSNSTCIEVFDEDKLLAEILFVASEGFSHAFYSCYEYYFNGC